jgi:hypothetical protein
MEDFRRETQVPVPVAEKLLGFRNSDDFDTTQMEQKKERHFWRSFLLSD